jgi:amino acid transporter
LPFVAGIDRYLPPAFGRLHPKWGTPHVALATQAAAAALVAVLGQAGASVKGAYDALVAMGVITYFIPYLVLFAAYARMKGDLRTPGGRPAVLVVSALGGATTLIALLLAAVPPADAADKTLAVAKVVGGSAVLAVVGAVLFARRRS